MISFDVCRIPSTNWYLVMWWAENAMNPIREKKWNQICDEYYRLHHSDSGWMVTNERVGYFQQLLFRCSEKQFETMKTIAILNDCQIDDDDHDNRGSIRLANELASVIQHLEQQLEQQSPHANNSMEKL